MNSHNADRSNLVTWMFSFVVIFPLTIFSTHGNSNIREIDHRSTDLFIGQTIGPLDGYRGNYSNMLTITIAINSIGSVYSEL